MNKTQIIGIGMVILGLLNIMSGQSPRLGNKNTSMLDLGGILLFSGAIIWWFGKVGEVANQDFAIFD